jgi:hypothetical protein
MSFSYQIGLIKDVFASAEIEGTTDRTSITGFHR